MHGTTPSPADMMIARVRGRPLAMARLARSLLAGSGRHDAARDLCIEAMELAPRDGELAALARPVMLRNIEPWYFTMVQDEARHALYTEAMRRTVRPGSTVLDIGAGCGLFAMMAAQAGANVIACERDPAVADAARAVVQANGLADRVTVIAADALDLRVGIDLPEPADALVWDNLANNLFGAGCAGTLQHARAHLLKPDAPLLPGRVEIMTALATDPRPADRAMARVGGFDIRAFNRLSPAVVTLASGTASLLSEGAAMFDVDCTDAIAAERTSATVRSTPGTVHGVVQWLRFHVAPGIVYDTSDPQVRAFGMQFHPIAPFTVDVPCNVTIHGEHDMRDTWFWVERGA